MTLGCPMSAYRLLLIASLLAALPASADNQAFPAVLAGHALLPARSFVTPPADAPSSLATSGKYTTADGHREERLESMAGHSYLSDKQAPKPTGISLPFKGQPVQGFSGIKAMADGSYWVLSDNGYGSKANSPDAALMAHHLRPDWTSGKVKRLASVFLHDPDRKVPFLITHEGTAKRYLTGADFDIESMQFIGKHLWFGDELGPYLIKTDRQGKVLAVFETQLDGKTLRSPDHYSVTTPATPAAAATFSTPVRRSRGYEGMAASKDGAYLYGLLEGPLWDESSRQWEMQEGREYLRIIEFGVADEKWTGRSWKYLLEANGNNIGDFNMIDEDTGLIIERDNGEGTADTACNGPLRPDCQNVPARFKRIYKISLKETDSAGFVRKIGYIDLLDIDDPAGRSRIGGQSGTFTFPFVTIEDVDIVDGQHIVVANDNNLPYSSGRQLGKNDDNEFVLLRVKEFLEAK